MDNTKPLNVVLEMKPIDTAPILLKPTTTVPVNTFEQIAPLVSAENYTISGVGTLRIKIVVLISTNYGTPIIGVTNNNSSFYIQEGEGMQVNDAPSNYNFWYFNFDLETGYLVNQITVFNNLADPKTSRGTVTTVQSTTPPVSPPIPKP